MGNPLFEPFYDSMRIAVPLAIQANNLEAEKNKTDQLFAASRDKLLQEAKQAQDKVALETSSKILQKTLESINPEDPTSVMAAKGQALRFEGMLGKPIFGRDEAGEILLPGIKPGKALGYGSSPLGIYDKDTGALTQAAPSKPESMPHIDLGDRVRVPDPNNPGRTIDIPKGTPPGAKNKIVADKVDLGDRTRLFYQDGTHEDVAKGTPPKAEAPVKIPANFRPTADGQGLEAIPGGPADQKTQQAVAKDQIMRDSTFSELDRLKAAAEEIRDHPGLAGIAGIQGKFPNIPGGEAANAAALFETLKSQTAFTVLQNMRNNSKTGGALGQVSDKEGQLLQNNLAALDKPQSYEAMKANLSKIVKYVDESKARINRAYETQYGKKSASEYLDKFLTPGE